MKHRSLFKIAAWILACCCALLAACSPTSVPDLPALTGPETSALQTEPAPPSAPDPSQPVRTQPAPEHTLPAIPPITEPAETAPAASVPAATAPDESASAATLPVQTLPSAESSPAPVFTLHFDAAGGSSAEETRTFVEGVPLGSLPEPVRIGYSFKGWYTSKIGGELWTGSDPAGPGDLTLYAKWTPLPLPKKGEPITLGVFAGEPVVWRVLATEGNRVLLISESVLDTQPYHKEKTVVSWETCTLRVWLNSVFYEETFRDHEKTAILTTLVINDDNPWLGTDGGNDTTDRIFLMSYAEKDRYYGTNAAGCGATAYAYSRGVSAGPSGTCNYWLRSPGTFRYTAGYVGTAGIAPTYGETVNNGLFGVRPLMWIEWPS